MKKTLLLTLFSVVSLVASAQSPKADKCEVFRPEVLGKNIIFEHEANKIGSANRFGQNTKSTNIYWEAYSDCDNNVTYMSSSTSSPKCGELKFSQAVRIAKIDYNTGMALVYSDPQKNIDYPKISADAEFYGWVPMKRLLLWSGCLANKHGIFNKALICSNYEAIKRQNEATSLDVGYKKPDKNSPKYSVENGASRFYFIMKRENGMALLATQSTMEGIYSRELLYCWIEEQNYVPWNQRTCLEPTWDREAVEYFIKQGIKTHPIYEQPNLSKFLANIKIPINDKLPKDALYMSDDEWDDMFRWPGDKLRNPILDGSTKDIWNLSTFTAPGGSIDIDHEELEAMKKNKEVLENKLKFNIVFVIDGTDSMNPYFPQVREAIKSSLNYFDAELQVKTGAVVYRNKADGERVTEVCPLTPRNYIARVTNFLDKVETKSVGFTHEEALYTGINTALDKMHFKDGESNIMIVIGDCGERIEGPDTQRDNIVARLVEKDIHLMSFQVNNVSGITAYSKFTSQMNYLIRNSMLRNYQKYITPENGKSRVAVNFANVTDAQSRKVGYEFPVTINGVRIKDEEILYIGTSRSVHPDVNGGKMPAETLQPLINETVKDFRGTIQKQLDILYAKMNNSAPIGRLAINDGTVSLGDEFANKLIKTVGNRTVNFVGYTRKAHSSENDHFKPVLFIEDKELQELLKMLEPVKQAADQSQFDYREPYIKALRSLVASLTGMRIEDPAISRMSVQEIMNMAGGITVDVGSLQSYTLDELNSPDVVDNGTYKSIIDDFSKKVEELRIIADSEHWRKRYAKDLNGECFYWIPVDRLP